MISCQDLGRWEGESTGTTQAPPKVNLSGGTHSRFFSFFFVCADNIYSVWRDALSSTRPPTRPGRCHGEEKGRRCRAVVHCVCEVMDSDLLEKHPTEVFFAGVAFGCHLVI